MEKPKTLLVWDIDDVLNRFVFLSMVRIPSAKNVRYEDLTVYPPLELLGITDEEFLAALDATRAVLYDEGPRPEVLCFFERHGTEFHHAVLSAVPIHFAPYSAQWLLHHFGKWIQTCIIIPNRRPGHVALEQRFKTKGEALRSLGADAVLIDDLPGNIADAQRYGCRTMTFPAPWNENRDLPIDDFLNGLLKLK